MKIKKILREPLFYLLPLLVVAYFINIPPRMQISDAKLTSNGKTKDIKIPHSSRIEEHKEFFISFNLSVKNTEKVKFRIFPDDCIQKILINGEKFSLDSIKDLCNYTNGIYFDFSKYVQEGSNSFELYMLNHGGPGGLRLEIRSYNGFKSLFFMHYVFVLLFLLSVALILRKFKFKLIAISIILLGISVRLVVFTHMGPMQSPYDIAEHLQYTQIIAEEKRIPEINEGWGTYQPPLYYIISAVVKNIADYYDTNLTNRFQQQFNLLLSFGCVIFGVALIINLFGNSIIAYLTALVPVLWPGFVIAGPRINNDCLFYFGALFCMLFAQRYWRFNKNLDMLLATIGATIALMAKSNGFVILGVWVIIYILNVIRSLKIGSLRILFASVFIIALSILFSNYRTIVNVFEGKKVALVGNASGLNGGLRVQNTIGNYLYFDLKDYLLFPYTSAWQDEGGRQYFWNYAIKSSMHLHKENRTWKYPIGNFLDTMLCIFALLIFVLALWGIIHVKGKDIPPLLFTISLFAALIYLRVSYPYSCSNEFRYIFPVLFPLAYFSMRGAQILQDSRLRKISYASMLAFAGLSVLFAIGQAI
jgi:hypothetical protein